MTNSPMLTCKLKSVANRNKSSMPVVPAPAPAPVPREVQKVQRRLAKRYTPEVAACFEWLQACETPPMPSCNH